MQRHTSLSRRGFLKAGGATAAGVAVLGLAGVAVPGGEHYGEIVGDERPVVLTEKEFAVLILAVESLIGQAGDLPSTRETRTAARIDRELSLIGGQLLEDMKASLLYLEYRPLLGGGLSRFTKLMPEARLGLLTELQHSGDVLERSIYAGIRFLAVFFFYTDPRAWAHMGYGGPLVSPKFFQGGNRIENLGASA